MSHAALKLTGLFGPSVDSAVQIKAAGGVRSLDDLLRVRALGEYSLVQTILTATVLRSVWKGVTRVGATAGPQMLEEAIKRGICDEPKLVQVDFEGELGGGY